ncbi:hypothetical protein BDY21DRAFT_283006 [Lineolata rhizophorae]|uniref:Kelch repeat protein n=1 Tax=Lineolata rhizophorae TaxID=578093 RepID=A0A6A6P554_9PEZI|nr:hypothetical protein BDY21DRAFT_283006 [Lineolata rhizophorae]
MAPLTATFTRLPLSTPLPRSSHCITASLLPNTLHLFGGELAPRQPVDNAVHVVSLASGAVHAVEAPPASRAGGTAASERDAAWPAPRVGAAAAALDGKWYVFSGRGGPDMTPLSDAAAPSTSASAPTASPPAVWCFDPHAATWTPLFGAGPAPSPRSYHALAACPSASSDPYLYLHAGCAPAAPPRLADLWRFDPRPPRAWTRLPDAPGPARGGASLAVAVAPRATVFRAHGFDGARELGGVLDAFDLAAGEWRVAARWGWEGGGGEAGAQAPRGPAPRSVAALLPLRVRGREVLVALGGERDPSAAGHAGAGRFHGDVWAFDVEGGGWEEVVVEGGEGPGKRGWFAADVVREEDGGVGARIVVAGGLDEENRRLGDVWVGEFK